MIIGFALGVVACLVATVLGVVWYVHHLFD